MLSPLVALSVSLTPKASPLSADCAQDIKDADEADRRDEKFMAEHANLLGTGGAGPGAAHVAMRAAVMALNSLTKADISEYSNGPVCPSHLAARSSHADRCCQQGVRDRFRPHQYHLADLCVQQGHALHD